MYLVADAQVHGRVLGGKTLADMPTFKGSYKEAERERFLNMVGILLPIPRTRGGSFLLEAPAAAQHQQLWHTVDAQALYTSGGQLPPANRHLLMQDLQEGTQSLMLG